MNKMLTGYPSIDKPWLKYYTEEQINAPLPHMTAYEYLRQQNAGHEDLQAIDSAFGNYTYCELFSMIDRTAAALWQLGVKKGQIVLEMLPVMPHESFLFYGVDVTGAALAPLAPMYPTEEVCKAARKFDAALFFTFDMLLTPEMEQAVYTQTGVQHIVSIGAAQTRDPRTMTWEAFLALGEGKPMPEISRDPKDLLFLASTGGSTGEPKSVMLNDNCFNIAVHQYINSALDYQAGDRWMRLWPIFSASAAIANFHLPLCVGMNNLLRVFPVKLESFDRMVLDDKPHHLIMIPQLLDAVEDSKLLDGQDLSHVKTAGCGGLSMTAQFEERVSAFYKKLNISCFLGHGWGCTESSTCGTMRMNHVTTRIGTVGIPHLNTTVGVFDPDTGAEMQYGQVGELCILSPANMMGYYRDLQTTEQVLRTHHDGSVWLHNGDLGSMDKDGIVTVKGRMTRVIFVFPTAKIYPQAMESAVSKVEGVQEVVFCQVPDQKHEGFFLPVCFIVPDGKHDSAEIVRNVRAFCRETMPEYAWPAAIHLRDRLPLTRVGKPDVRKLEAELLAGNAE